MPSTLLLSPEDFFIAEQEKSRRILSQFSTYVINSPQEPEFDAAYKLLDAEFGARGELERREVLEKWMTSSSPSRPLPTRIEPSSPSRLPVRPNLGEGRNEPSSFRGEGGEGRGEARYFMLIIRDETGNIAGVRDCYVTNDPEQPERCVVYLAHVLVLPAYRRSGVASLLRTAPVVLARQVTTKLTTKHAEILLAGEMEPLHLESPDTLVRLVAYGKSGFWAIPPKVLPYCQPDFRDLEALQVPPSPIPLLAVIRYVGRETEEKAPVWVAKAFVERLYGVFSESCRPQDLQPALTHSLEAVSQVKEPEIALLPLPRNAEDTARITPLLRENVLVYFPASVVSSQ